MSQKLDPQAPRSMKDDCLSASGPIRAFAEVIIDTYVEKVHMAQVMDLIEATVPRDAQPAAKRLYQTLQRELVRRIDERATDWSKFMLEATIVIPKDRIRTSDEQRVIDDLLANVHMVSSGSKSESSDGLLRVGQLWRHSSGSEMRIVAVNVDTKTYGRTNIAEEPDGSLKPVAGDKESLVNWTLISE